MGHTRRKILKAGGSLGLFSVLAVMGLVRPGDAWAQAWAKGLFDARGLAEALKALGAGAPAMSGDIVITAPEVAENGAVVPVGALSKLPRTQQIAYLIEKNPNTVTAVFDFQPNVVPEIQTRVKLGQSSNLMILVKADGKFYAAQKEIKVTVGGCGN